MVKIRKKVSTNNFIKYFFVPIVVVIIYLILNIPIIDRNFSKTIPNRLHRIFICSIIIFNITYLSNLSLIQWYKNRK